MIVLNEVSGNGMRRLELWPDDVADVTTLSWGGGSEVNTIDGRRFHVVEDVAEVFTRLEASERDGWDELA